MSRARDFADLAGSADAGGLTGRNLLINGAQQISQRGTSFTGQGANGSPYFTDRWYAFSGGTSAGRFTATQEAITDLSGFTQALKLDCTTADTSIGADEQLALIQAVEAQNLQHLKFGTSNAVPLTYSFYAKANAAKTYIAELYAGDGSAKSQSHAFNVTTSWQRFEITFSATGADAATIDNNNGIGLYVLIALHAGSNLASGTINSTWAAATQANRHVGCDSFYSSTDNTFFFTGAQLEVGEQATPFEHRSYAEQLQLCRRYFTRYTGNTVFAVGQAISTSQATVSVPLQQPMRVAPTKAQSGIKMRNSTGNSATASALSIANKTEDFIELLGTRTGSGLTAGNACQFRVDTTSDYLDFDAEF